MRRAAKIDINQNSIVTSLRFIPGISVKVTSALGEGFGDIIVGFRKTNYIFEIKDGDKPPSQRKLTPDEQKFHAGWNGQIAVIESFEDIMKILGIEKRQKTA